MNRLTMPGGYPNITESDCLTLRMIKRLAVYEDTGLMPEEVSRLNNTLMGVTHFIDKWLDGNDLKLDEVSRTAKMREITLDIMERQENEIGRLTAELEWYRQREPITLCFGSGQYMIADTFQEGGDGAGICVYRNPNPQPALDQTDTGSTGKDIDDVGAIIHLRFSNTDSIEVWIRSLLHARETLREQSRKEKDRDSGLS